MPNEIVGPSASSFIMTSRGSYKVPRLCGFPDSRKLHQRRTSSDVIQPHEQLILAHRFLRYLKKPLQLHKLYIYIYVSVVQNTE